MTSQCKGAQSGCIQPREPIEFLESEPWIVEFSATRRSSDMDYLLMGGVIACFAACFASVSPVALSCCPNEPQTVLVSPVSPVEEEHRVPVLVEHPDSSVAVAYEPREAKRNKKRRCCMIQFMWQDDIRGVAVFIKECLEVYYGTDPDGGQASDQP